MKFINCQNCDRTLLEVDGFKSLAIKCRRCGHFNHFKRTLSTHSADLASPNLILTGDQRDPIKNPTQDI